MLNVKYTSHLKDFIRAPPKLGRYWEIHPEARILPGCIGKYTPAPSDLQISLRQGFFTPRPERLPEGKVLHPETAKPELNPES